MTIISLSEKYAVATEFTASRPKISGVRTPPRKRFSLGRLFLRKEMQFLATSIGILAFAGILITGIDSIRLAFTIQNVRREIQAAEKSNESLLIQASALRAPEFLWRQAAMLELSEPNRVKYLATEGPAIAGTLLDREQKF